LIDQEYVETYRGPHPAQELGATLMHEHIFVRDQELELSMEFPEWDQAAMIDRAVQGLSALHRLGIDTIVDLTVPGLGRDPSLVQEVARRAPVTIIASTGWYGAAVLPAFFQLHGPNRLVAEPDPLIKLFMRDINEGIGTSGVKAGMLKVTSSDGGITADESRAMGAAATAARETGVPVTTHSSPATRNGLEQQRFFRAHRVPLDRVVIGHSGDTDDVDYLRELMDAGSTIGLDRFGMEHVLNDDRRVDTLLSLISLGYADRLVISHDAAFYSHVTPPSWRSRAAPKWRMDNITTNVLPRLRAAGIGQEEIDLMLVANPKRLLQRRTQ
jgi:phosphotriesterase-related protein